MPSTTFNGVGYILVIFLFSMFYLFIVFCGCVAVAVVLLGVIALCDTVIAIQNCLRCQSSY